MWQVIGAYQHIIKDAKEYAVINSCTAEGGGGGGGIALAVSDDVIQSGDLCGVPCPLLRSLTIL